MKEFKLPPNVPGTTVICIPITDVPEYLKMKFEIVDMRKRVALLLEKRNLS